MSFGKVYTREGNPRTVAIRAVAKANGLELDFETVQGANECSDEYLALNPLGKVPTFVRHDGWVLRECLAISVYMTQQNPNSPLLGKGPDELAQNIKWMSFLNNDVYDSLGGWFLPLIGRRPYSKVIVEENIILVGKRMRMMDSHLSKTQYLTGNELRLCDIFCTGLLAAAFMCLFDRKWREEHPHLTRWVRDVYHQPIYQAVCPGGLVEIETAIPNEPVSNPNSYAR